MAGSIADDILLVLGIRWMSLRWHPPQLGLQSLHAPQFFCRCKTVIRTARYQQPSAQAAGRHMHAAWRHQRSAIRNM